MSDTVSAASGAEGAQPGPVARAAKTKAPQQRPSLFARSALFVRQIVAELKKVIRPTRSELVTYTSVVLIFVVIVMAFVTGVDLVVGKLMFWVFGG